MERRNPDEQSLFELLLKQRGIYVFCALFLCFAFRYYSRDFWFDECLTLDLIFYCPDTLTVYQTYDIPNNHIVFSILLRFWILFLGKCLPDLYLMLFRLLPMVCACGAAVWIFRTLQRKFSAYCAWCVALCFCMTPPFLIYGTGLRGYILGFLLTCGGVAAARSILKYGKIRYYIFYSLLALLAVGTAPTNLASFVAISLLFFPAVMNNKRNILPLLYLFLSPFVCLAIFYLPIFEKFKGCIALKEGWYSAGAAAWHFYATVFLILLPCILMFRIRKKLKWYAVMLLLTILIPAGVYLVFPTAPFPRVFLPLLAVWCFPAGYGVGAFLCRFPAGKKYIPVLLVFFWGALVTIFSPRIGDLLFGNGWQDDLMAPYYVREDFMPSVTVQRLEQCRKEYPDAVFYMTFESDYPALLFATAHWADRDSVMWYDRPNQNRLQSLPETGTLYFITRDETDMEAARKRFSLPFPVERISCGSQNIWRFTR